MGYTFKCNIEWNSGRWPIKKYTFKRVVLYAYSSTQLPHGLCFSPDHFAPSTAHKFYRYYFVLQVK